MNTAHPTEAESLERYSRRGIWIALALLIILAAYAVAINFFPEADASAGATRLLALLPIAITIALLAMRTALKGTQPDTRGRAMQRLLHDELRVHSTNLSYRNGFFGMLLAQPILFMCLSLAPQSYPLALIASATALIGVVVFLASLLAYDR